VLLTQRTAPPMDFDVDKTFSITHGYCNYQQHRGGRCAVWLE
jgi:hypothetical protein